MKRILLSLMILISSATLAYSSEDLELSSFGFSFGCFIPQDMDYDNVYGDERETTFSLFYDMGLTKSFALGTSLMYTEDEGIGVSPGMVPSTVESDIHIGKLNISIIYRMILAEDQLIVPQIKAGIGGTYFNEKVEGGKRTENGYFGYNASFALLLLLDRLEPDYAKKLRDGFKIEDTYFFIEAGYSDTDDLDAGKINLSGVEYSAGLMFRYWY